MWKRYFFEGLALLLPLVLTIIIFLYLVAFFSSPLDALILALFPSLPFPEFTAKAIALFLTLTLFLMVGYFAQKWILAAILKRVNALFLKIPVIKKIYHSCNEVITTLLREKDRGFSETALFPFGDTNGYVVGFVPRKDTPFEDKYPILMAGTPNPLQGFVLFVEEKNLHASSISVQKAVKWTISLGTTPL